jgi:hypothetical protein
VPEAFRVQPAELRVLEVPAPLAADRHQPIVGLTPAECKEIPVRPAEEGSACRLGRAVGSECDYRPLCR